MKIQNVTDPEFLAYGEVLDLDSSEIVDYLRNQSKMPSEGNFYCRDEKAMASLKGVREIRERIFGTAPIETGYCNGFNSLLNCMEYHACPEVDVAGEDLVLLLGRKEEIQNGEWDSSCAKAFLLKRGQSVCLYPYTLHFSPCKLSAAGFRCAIILSEGTNADLLSKPSDPLLWKINKWLIAHPSSKQASMGAHMGITGKNIKIDY